MDVGPWADQGQRAQTADTRSSGGLGSACMAGAAGAQRLRGQQGRSPLPGSGTLRACHHQIA
eukprot:6828278-Lingulodinium_polyedra.AAC.1